MGAGGVVPQKDYAVLSQGETAQIGWLQLFSSTARPQVFCEGGFCGTMSSLIPIYRKEAEQKYGV